MVCQEDDEIRRGKAKRGTTHFHCYATAYVIKRNKRITLAVTYVRGNDTLIEILERLLSRLAKLKIRLRSLLLDKVAREYALFSEFEIEGMPNGYVKFITEPDPKQPSKVIFVIQAGSMHGDYYLLRRDGKSADMIAIASRDELIDLDHDGIYEFLLFHRHGGIDIFHRHGGIDIFQWDNISFSYQKVWPPEGVKYSVVWETLYDVDDDSDKEIAAPIREKQTTRGESSRFTSCPMEFLRSSHKLT